MLLINPTNTWKGSQLKFKEEAWVYIAPLSQNVLTGYFIKKKKRFVRVLVLEIKEKGKIRFC